MCEQQKKVKIINKQNVNGKQIRLTAWKTDEKWQRWDEIIKGAWK